MASGLVIYQSSRGSYSKKTNSLVIALRFIGSVLQLVASGPEIDVCAKSHNLHLLAFSRFVACDRNQIWRADPCFPPTPCQTASPKRPRPCQVPAAARKRHCRKWWWGQSPSGYPRSTYSHQRPSVDRDQPRPYRATHMARGTMSALFARFFRVRVQPPLLALF